MDILTVALYALPAAFYALAWWNARPASERAGAFAMRSAAMGAAGPVAQDAGHGALGGPLHGAGDVRHDLSHAAVARDSGSIGSWWLLAALVLHAGSITLAVGVGSGQGLRYGFAQALSAVLWLGAALLWFESLRVRVAALQLVVLPGAAVAALLPLFFPGVELGPLGERPLVLPHLLVGTLAYGVLMMAALHAALMTAAERALHGVAGAEHSMFARWFEELPPLLVLERMLFRFIWIGFVLLTLTAVSGIVFSEEVFGQPLTWNHKTVFTLIAWATFGLLLVGRARWGWRGRTALRLTMSGFAMLVLAYVGTRFVLEVVLHRV